VIFINERPPPLSATWIAVMVLRLPRNVMDST